MSTETALTEAHRLAQIRQGAKTAVDLANIWSLLDLSAIDATAPRWLEIARAIVISHGTESAHLAQQYLQSIRGLTVGSPGHPATWLPNTAAIDTSLMVTGPIRAKKLAGTGRTLADISDIARASSSAAGQRHALGGGRSVITDTLRHDQRARGYARVTSGGSCDFCQMLAGRGAVYSARTGSFEAHDGCGCSAKPVYA